MAKTNLSKLLPKFLKKGGQEVKDLTQKILDNAAAYTKRKQENDKATKEGTQTKGPTAEGTGLKRLRDADGGLGTGSKRMAVAGNPKDAPKPAGSTKGAQMSKLPVAPALRPKPHVVAPKPSSLFGTLSSASKRPGTTNAERAAAAAAAKPRYVASIRTIPDSPFIDIFAVLLVRRKRTRRPSPPFLSEILWLI